MMAPGRIIFLELLYKVYIRAMTPDKRLDQIEPVMADVLQKVDRLVEGQGQLVEFAVNTKAELEEVKVTINDHVVPTLDTLTQQMNGQVIPTLDQVKTSGEITAAGLAKLTVTVSDFQDEMCQRFERNEQTQQEILAILRDRL